MGFWRNQLVRSDRPGGRRRVGRRPEPRKGFFTDTSICIGCKACEVACKEWNAIPEDGLDLLSQSYDNTGALGASTWRHVAFIEQTSDRIEQARESGRQLVDLGMPSVRAARAALASRRHGDGDSRCRCQLRPARQPATGRPTRAGLPLADGLRRVQALHPRRLPRRLPHRRALPHRVRHGRRAGRRLQRLRLLRARPAPSGSSTPATARGGRRSAGTRSQNVAGESARQKCTLCYDRLGAGPDAGVRPGLPDDVDQVRRPRRDAGHGAGAGRARCTQLGFSEARLYGATTNDGVGGTGSMFLLLDEPEVYGLPPDPRVTTADLPDMFRKAGYGGAGDARDGSRLVRREAQVTTNPFDADRPPERAAAAAATAPAPAAVAAPRRVADGPGRRASTATTGATSSSRAPWEKDIPAYLFLGGLAAGSALLGAGGAARDLPRAAPRRPDRRRRRRCRSAVRALAKDLGKPSRALNMMRTVKLTSPMSVGSWILTAFGSFAGAASPPRSAAEARAALAAGGSGGSAGWPRRCGSPTGPATVGSALFAPPLAAYTAVLLADTATPTWHESYRELPFVFVSSANAAASGLALVTVPAARERPGAQARRRRAPLVELVAFEQHGGPARAHARRSRCAPARPGGC